jgi:hypothetical protein
MKKTRCTCHVVELALDPTNYPDTAAFIALLAKLPALGVLKCVEIAIGPQGGGHLAFVVHEAPAPEALRTALKSLVGADAIRRCKARPA